MFRFAILSALIASVRADIPADSAMGRNLLSKARRVANNGGNNYNSDMTWMADYSIKFNKCHTVHSVQSLQQQDEHEHHSQDGDSEQANSQGYKVQHVVNFQLCPSNSCSSCSGGAEYVVDMSDFVQTYVSAVQAMEQSACQEVANKCDCQYYEGDDYSCLASCYKSAGLSNCVDNQNDGNSNFNIANHLECQQAGFGANAYGYSSQTWYVGPVCANSGKAIHLAVFTDNMCSIRAPSGTYEKYNNGNKLPYSSESMVQKSCISCMNQAQYYDANANGDDGNAGRALYYQVEVNESCTQMYEEAAKCETNLKAKSSMYRDTGACTYIKDILPALERVYKAKTGGGGASASTAFAWIFALTTIASSGVAYSFYKKVQRTTVGLATQDGGNYA